MKVRRALLAAMNHIADRGLTDANSPSQFGLAEPDRFQPLQNAGAHNHEGGMISLAIAFHNSLANDEPISTAIEAESF